MQAITEKHRFFIKILLLIQSISCQWTIIDGKCIMGMATCGTTPAVIGPDLPIPCKYDGPPRVVDDKQLLSKFDLLCPSLNVLENQDKGLCCSAEQIKQFVDQMQQAQNLIGTCPSCLINFSQLFCDLACNPNQADFLQVINATKFNSTHDTVDRIQYTVGDKFVNGLYNSCKDVIFRDTQEPALNFMCGDPCSPHDLVEHLGIKGNSPFDISYTYTEDDTHSRAIPCNSSVSDVYPRLKNVYKSRCSLVDCPIAVQPTPPPATSWFTQIGAIKIIIYTFCIIIIMLLVFAYDKYGNHEDLYIDMMLTKLFTKWAFFCATNAKSVIVCGLLLAAVASLGLMKIQIITDPVELWSESSSQARQEKTYFEDNFGPFYRVEQVIVYPAEGYAPWMPYDGDQARTFSNVFKLDFLMSVLKLQKSIIQLEAKHEGKPVRLTDICVQPLDNNICSIQSPLDWFQATEANFLLNGSVRINTTSSIDTASSPSQVFSVGKYSNTTEHQPAYLKHFMTCFKNAYDVKDKDYHNLSCLGPYGGPIYPHIGLGGYPDKSYWEANSLIITIPVKNTQVAEAKNLAKAWEKKFLELLTSYNDSKLRLAFYSERSIEDEIDRQSQSDVSTIAISYLVMFAYVALSLGRFRGLRRCLIDSRIVLGLGGITIVLASVLSSVGILSLFGVRATLIIVEVIPFLVLAIGVDNIFILVQALQRSINHRKDQSVEKKISEVVGEVAPSLLLASLSESTCFLIGALTPMPAVRVFAMTASLALVIDFILQMTVFISLLTLDTKRQLSGRFDLFFCIKASENNGSYDVSISCPATTNSSVDSLRIDTDLSSIDEVSSGRPDGTSDLLYTLVERYIAPTLMMRPVRIVSMLIFFLWIATSLTVMRDIDVGLDQTMSVPDDSYMQTYFDAQRRDLRVGPPVFFVLKKGLKFDNETERNSICSSDGCYTFSLASHISQASRDPNTSYIATPSNSWIDAYKSWGSDGTHCCRMFKDSPTPVKTKFTQLIRQYSAGGKFCPFDTPDIDKKCKQCDLIDRDNHKFDPDVFYDYLDNFLHDVPRVDCPNGGSAVYSNLVRIHPGHGPDAVQKDNLIPSAEDHPKPSIDSAFSSYHVPLKNSRDFIESMKSARQIAQKIEDMLNTNLRPQTDELNSKNKLQVFPYCFTYVFYEQYLTIWKQTFRNLFISMATIFIVTYMLLGCDLYISSVVIGTIASIIINLMGLMYFWDIQLNAISLVNLVMAVGISVEFCAHVARAFALSAKQTSVERAQDALVKMGSSVLSGITLTKIAGISILAFAKSRIFKVYYFRLYMGIVLVGALHGIIFLPIIFSLTARERKRSSPLVEKGE